MANTFFQFKKFIVHQEHTAMKVCTDACLFGGWLSQEQPLLNASTILDIGTGTGLLSLMLAQANEKAIITAIEIEPLAAKQAAQNFSLSPWENRLHIKESSLQNYFTATPRNTFDCIISNPPFFEGDLLSPDAQKNLAAHSTALPWETLIDNAFNILKEDGYFYVIVPSLRAYTFQKLATLKGMHFDTEITIYNTTKSAPFRSMLKFIKGTTSDKQINRHRINIKEEDNNYSPEFIKLLSPYYLHL